jgi:hypothetical protein
MTKKITERLKVIFRSKRQSPKDAYPLKIAATKASVPATER